MGFTAGYCRLSNSSWKTNAAPESDNSKIKMPDINPAVEWTLSMKVFFDNRCGIKKLLELNSAKINPILFYSVLCLAIKKTC